MVRSGELSTVWVSEHRSKPCPLSDESPISWMLCSVCVEAQARTRGTASEGPSWDRVEMKTHRGQLHLTQRPQRGVMLVCASLPQHVHAGRLCNLCKYLRAAWSA